MQLVLIKSLIIDASAQMALKAKTVQKISMTVPATRAKMVVSVLMVFLSTPASVHLDTLDLTVKRRQTNV